MNKLIINFTPTGMIPTKKMTPHVPISVNEIVKDIKKAYRKGITMVHLHPRDEKTREPTYKKSVFAKIIRNIRKFAPDLILCVSLSGRDFKTFKQRSQALQLKGNLKPDMGSLTLSSLNFNKIVSLNSPDMVVALAEEMKKKKILPELEAFDAGMINYAKYLERKKIIKPPHYFNLLLGNIACAQADLLHAGLMIRDLPNKSTWSLAGIGDYQLQMNSTAIAMGGGVRVGLEDNIWYTPSRKQLATNLELIKRIHVIAKANGRKIMKPKELRTKLQLEPGYGKYGLVK